MQNGISPRNQQSGIVGYQLTPGPHGIEEGPNVSNDSQTKHQKHHLLVELHFDNA